MAQPWFLGHGYCAPLCYHARPHEWQMTHNIKVYPLFTKVSGKVQYQC